MMLYGNPGDVDTESSGLISDLASTQTKTALTSLPIGEKSVFTDFTFPTARIGIEFYAKKPGELKDQIIGEMEKSALKVDAVFQDIVNKMGDGAGLGAVLRENITKAVTDVRLMGLDFKDIQATAVATLETFGRNVSLTDEEYKNILATQQVTGVESKKLIEGFANAGMSIKDITGEMDTVLNVANAIGVNAKAVSGKVVENLDKLNKFGFQNGIEGLAKMAAKAQILRIDMKEIFTLADTLMDPEGAIDLASNLQRLGATSAALTDPLRLMDMAQNDVGALTDELGKMFSQYAEFSEENQRFEILPTARREIRQLEQDLKLPAGTIEKMAIGTKDLEKKLSEISFSGLDIPQETQELIANMSMMGEDGEYRIKYVDEEGKTREETTAEFLDKFGSDVEAMKTALGKQQEIEGETIEEKMFRKAEEQLTALEAIKANTLASTGALGLSMGGGEFGKNFLEMQREAAKTTNQAIIDNLGPKGPIFQEYQNLAKNTKDAFDILTGKKEGDKGKAGIDVAVQMGDVVTTTMTSVFQTGKDIITGSLENVGVDLSTIKIPGLSALTDFNFDELKQSAIDLGKEGFEELKSKAASLGINFDSISQKLGLTSSVQTQGTTTTGVNLTPSQQINQITSPPNSPTASNITVVNPNDNTTASNINVVNPNPNEQGGTTIVNPAITPTETTASNINVVNPNVNPNEQGAPQEINVTLSEEQLKSLENLQLAMADAIDIMKIGIDKINSNPDITKDQKEKEIKEFIDNYTNTVIQPMSNQISSLTSIGGTSVTSLLSSGNVDFSKMMVGPPEASLGGGNYDLSTFTPLGKTLGLNSGTINNLNNTFGGDSNTENVNNNSNQEINTESILNVSKIISSSMEIIEEMKSKIGEVISSETLTKEQKVEELKLIQSSYNEKLEPLTKQISTIINEGGMSVSSLIANSQNLDFSKLQLKGGELGGLSDEFFETIGLNLNSLKDMLSPLISSSDSILTANQSMASSVQNNDNTSQTILDATNSIASSVQTNLDTSQTILDANNSIASSVQTNSDTSQTILDANNSMANNVLNNTTTTNSLFQTEPSALGKYVSTGKASVTEFGGTENYLNQYFQDEGVATYLSRELDKTNKEKESITSVVSEKERSTAEIVKGITDRAQKLYNEEEFIKNRKIEETLSKTSLNNTIDVNNTPDLSNINVVNPNPTEQGGATVVNPNPNPTEQGGATVVNPAVNTTATTVNPGLPKPTEGNTAVEPSINAKDLETIANNAETTLQDFSKVVTSPDFGFGPEVGPAISEFKGGSNIISEYNIPEAIVSAPAPIAQTYDERLQQLQSTTISNLQTNTIEGTARVEVNITGSKDAQTERQLKGTITKHVEQLMTYNQFQRKMNEASSDEMANFGLNTSNIRQV